MARPTAGISTNSSPRYLSTSRDRRSPGLRPTVDIAVPQQPNQFDGLVQALDQFEGAISAVSRQQIAEKDAAQKAQQRIIQANAADQAGRSIVDETDKLLRENPNATEEDVAALIDTRIAETLGHDGEYTEVFPDETARLLAKGQLEGIRGKVMSAAGESIRKRTRETALNAAADSFAAGGTFTPQSWASLKQAAAAAGLTGSEANKYLAEVAISVAEMKEDPSVIASIPDKWEDGTPTFKLTAEYGDEITKAQRQVGRVAEAKRLEGLEMTRVEWLTAARAGADRGRGLTKSQMAEGLSIGVAEGTLVSINDGAAAARDRAAEKAERRAEARRQEALLRQNMATNIHAVSASDRNKAIDAEYNASPQGKGRLEVIQRYAAQGYLPPTWVNYLSNPAALRSGNARQWSQDMRWLRNTFPDVYAQKVPAHARANLTAYDSLIRGGLSPEKARTAVAESDPKRINLFDAKERGKVASKITKEMDLTDPVSGTLVGNTLRNFLALPGVNIEEARDMTARHIRETTFVSGGRLYQRSLVPSPEALEAIRMEAAEEYKVDPDQIEIFEDANGTRIGTRVRGQAAGDWIDPEVSRSWYLEKTETERRVAVQRAQEAAAAERVGRLAAEFDRPAERQLRMR